MPFTKHVVCAASLLGFWTCNAFVVGWVGVPRASVLGSGSSVLGCQRQQRSSMSLGGNFEMPHVTKKRKKQGFGGGKAKIPAEKGKTLTTGEAVARHMLQEYNAIKADGGMVARLYARLKETEEWYPVGYVCTPQPGWTAQGTQGQKRLILDHASEMYSQLRSGAGKKLVLEAGYGPEEGAEGEINLCKGIKYNGERVGVALDPLPDGPFFKAVTDDGFGVDKSPAATLRDNKKR